jgi:hypothetical protein
MSRGFRSSCYWTDWNRANTDNIRIELVFAVLAQLDVFFKCLRQRSNELKICLPAVFYMCFLGFIRYNKTFIACGFRKYENLFTHEYHIPLEHCPQGIWHSWISNSSRDFSLQLSKCLEDSDLAVIGLTGIGPIRTISVLNWFLPYWPNESFILYWQIWSYKG